MTATAMLIDLHRSGIRLEARGDRLHVEAKPGTFTDDLRRLLTEHKADLLAELSKPESVTTTTDTRARLHRLVAGEGLSPGCVDTIPDDELHLYAELDDDELRLPLHLRARCAQTTQQSYER